MLHLFDPGIHRLSRLPTRLGAVPMHPMGNFHLLSVYSTERNITRQSNYDTRLSLWHAFFFGHPQQEREKEPKHESTCCVGERIRLQFLLHNSELSAIYFSKLYDY